MYRDLTMKEISEQPVSYTHLTGQQGDHHADVSSQSEEWIQCGLWYADAGSIDLYTSYSDHLPVFTEELCKWNYGSSGICLLYTSSDIDKFITHK